LAQQAIVKRNFSMNRFYQAANTGRNTYPDRKIDLFVGDKKFETDVGCFEVLFVIDKENQISKLECNFLLDCSFSGLLYDVVDPSLIYVNLPKDLLHKREPYELKMFVTQKETIDAVSNFTKNLDGTATGDKIYSEHDFPKIINEILTETKSYSDNRQICNDIYETIDLPEVAKFRCRKFNQSQGQIFGCKHVGWYFSFHTSVSKILDRIVYNNFKDCSIDQLHTGENGDNIKQFQ